MAKDPAFLMYPKDWLEGTAEMRPEEKGVYIDLLCYQHQRGGLPIDTKRLSIMVGLDEIYFNTIWSYIKCKFVEKNGLLYNTKLEKISTERSDYSEMRVIIGTFGQLLRVAKCSDKEKNRIKEAFDYKEFINEDKQMLNQILSKWIANALANTLPKTKQTIEIEDGIGNEDYNIKEDDVKKSFEQARKIYPGVKRGFETEYENFKKKHPDYKAISTTLMPAIEKEMKWRGNITGDFIPQWKHFQTWINQRDWEKELPTNGATTNIQKTPGKQYRDA